MTDTQIKSIETKLLESEKMNWKATMIQNSDLKELIKQIKKNKAYHKYL